jgi:hypothetical protein
MTGGHGPAARSISRAMRSTSRSCPATARSRRSASQAEILLPRLRGQLIELGSEFRKGELMALFGTRMGWLDTFWPQWKKVGERGERPMFEKDGFSQKGAAGADHGLLEARLFDPKGKVRGRGAHRGDDGELVLHCGDAVLVGGRKGVKGDRALKSAWFKSGAGRRLRLSDAAGAPRPDEEPASVASAGKSSPASKRGTGSGARSPRICCCAGWRGAARRRAAHPPAWLDRRPVGRGQDDAAAIPAELMGDWGVFTEDATEAGVRQLLDQDTLAVMFDEIEAEADNRDVVMRSCAWRGSLIRARRALRGSSDHQAKQFVARSCFLFSSIHHHELPAQDRNRIAILQLSRRSPRTRRNSCPAAGREWGDQLRRRLIEQWPRFDATLAAYQPKCSPRAIRGASRTPTAPCSRAATSAARRRARRAPGDGAGAGEGARPGRDRRRRAHRGRGHQRAVRQASRLAPPAGKRAVSRRRRSHVGSRS